MTFITEWMQENEIDAEKLSELRDKASKLRSLRSQRQPKTMSEYTKYSGLSEEELADVARDLLFSQRGNLIIGKALYQALGAMESREEVEQEPSNQADLELLGSTYFKLGWNVAILEERAAQEGFPKNDSEGE